MTYSFGIYPASAIVLFVRRSDRLCFALCRTPVSESPQKVFAIIPKSVFDFDRNRCSIYSEMSVRHGPKFALICE